MKIVLNEKAMLNKSLSEGYIDKKPTRTIRLLAKHYFSIGQNKKQVMDSIDNFMHKNFPDYNFVDWNETIKRQVNKVHKIGNFGFLDINKVVIYKNELDIIQNLNNIRLEKLAFVLLIYSKIYNQMNGNDSNWVNSELKDIFSDTKMAVSKKEQEMTIHNLKNVGLLEVSKIIDCTNIKVMFVSKEGETVFEITDFRDFVLIYLKYKGDKIGSCGKCDRLIILKNNKTLYCNECAREVKLENDRRIQKEKYENYRK